MPGFALISVCRQVELKYKDALRSVSDQVKEDIETIHRARESLQKSATSAERAGEGIERDIQHLLTSRLQEVRLKLRLLEANKILWEAQEIPEADIAITEVIAKFESVLDFQQLQLTRSIAPTVSDDFGPHDPLRPMHPIMSPGKLCLSRCALLVG